MKISTHKEGSLNSVADTSKKLREWYKVLELPDRASWPLNVWSVWGSLEKNYNIK